MSHKIDIDFVFEKTGDGPIFTIQIQIDFIVEG